MEEEYNLEPRETLFETIIIMDIFLTQDNTSFKLFAGSNKNWKIQHMLSIAERTKSNNGSNMYRLVVSDISYKDFTQIYNEITPGLRPVINDINAIAVMKVAHKFQLTQLEMVCVNQMLPLLNHANVCFMFSESYECPNILNKICNDFIMREFETLIDDNILMMEMSETVVQWILSQHRLGMDNGLVEYKLFAAIVKWADIYHTKKGQNTYFHDSSNVGYVLKFIASRLKHIRLELINPYLISNERIKLVYLAAMKQEAKARTVHHKKHLNPNVKPFVYRRKVLS